MRIFTLIFLCSAIFNVGSTELTPAERMLHAMGIDQVLNQAKEAQAKSSQEQVKMVMRQLSGTLSKIPPEKVKEIEVLFQSMMNDVSNSWTTEEAIRIYSQTWADNFTKEEILKVAEKYEQPESKKELEMVMMASANLSNYISNSYSKATEVAFADFMPKMQSIMKEGIKMKQSKSEVSSD